MPSASLQKRARPVQREANTTERQPHREAASSRCRPEECVQRVPASCRPQRPRSPPARSRFFFFNDTATTEIYPLSLHDALPIYMFARRRCIQAVGVDLVGHARERDRKSTRLNSSHGYISYAVFCLKKKKNR